MRAIAAINGQIKVMERKQASLLPGHIKVKTMFSAISAGTELTMLEISKQRTEPLFIGYSAMGQVVEAGEGVDATWIGQRVACYGAPYVHHGQYLHVPTNLAAPIAGNVSSEEAAFAGLGAIGIHALRTARLQFGESVVVVGLGILGNIIAQIAKAAAYETAGIDIDEQRVAGMQACGVEHAYVSDELLDNHLAHVTGGKGVDAILLCASGPGRIFIDKALDRIRLGGKIVIVGDIQPEFSREKMFAKEATILISRAGGAGRYDAHYERDNIDYPIGFVRWTEGRNTAEYIRLLAKEAISLKPIITHQYALAEAELAFHNYTNKTDAIGTVISYD